MNAPTDTHRRHFAVSVGSLIAGIALASPARAEANSPSSSRSEALIRRLYDAVNNKNLDVIAAYGAPFSEWLDVPFDFTTRGERAIIDPWKSWFDIFPDATCEVRCVTALGNHVVAQGVGRGTHRGVFNSPAGVLQPSGRALAVAFCDVYELRGDKILRADSYFDFYGLVNQLVAEPLRAGRR
jgi:ketosteroid isomerase-like protein